MYCSLQAPHKDMTGVRQHLTLAVLSTGVNACQSLETLGCGLLMKATTKWIT